MSAPLGPERDGKLKPQERTSQQENYFLGLPSKISRSESCGNVLWTAEEEVATNGLGRFAQEKQTFEQVRLPIAGEVGTEFCGRPGSCNQLCEEVAQDLQGSSDTKWSSWRAPCVVVVSFASDGI